MPSLLDLVDARQGHFKLESGYHGGLWLDLEPLFVAPDRLRPFVVDLAQQIAAHSPQAICGPLLGGAFLAQAIASELSLAFYFTERYTPPDAKGLYAVQYRLPPALQHSIVGQRVAVVDDAISAGSSVRATLAALQTQGASVVAVGALLLMGTTGRDYFTQLNVPVASVLQVPYQVWTPETCPLCAAGQPLDAP